MVVMEMEEKEKEEEEENKNEDERDNRRVQTRDGVGEEMKKDSGNVTTARTAMRSYKCDIRDTIMHKCLSLRFFFTPLSIKVANLFLIATKRLVALYDSI